MNADSEAHGIEPRSMPGITSGCTWKPHTAPYLTHLRMNMKRRSVDPTREFPNYSLEFFQWHRGAARVPGLTSVCQAVIGSLNSYGTCCTTTSTHTSWRSQIWGYCVFVPHSAYCGGCYLSPRLALILPQAPQGGTKPPRHSRVVSTIRSFFSHLTCSGNEISFVAHFPGKIQNDVLWP